MASKLVHWESPIPKIVQAHSIVPSSCNNYLKFLLDLFFSWHMVLVVLCNILGQYQLLRESLSLDQWTIQGPSYELRNTGWSISRVTIPRDLHQLSFWKIPSVHSFSQSLLGKFGPEPSTTSADNLFSCSSFFTTISAVPLLWLWLIHQCKHIILLYEGSHE